MLNQLKRIVKELFANKRFRETYNWVMLVIYKVFSLNKLFSILYHWVFFIPFYREQYAVLSGKYQYFKNNGFSKRSNHHLRRNIHRLEKAMIYKEVKSVFALNYIEETVDAYKVSVNRSCNDNICDIDELTWATDVLSKYFEIVDSIKITTFKLEFEKAKENIQSKLDPNRNHSKTPYAAKSRPSTSISYDNFLALCMRRRSVRWFSGEKVPRELIDKAIFAARQAPSACNRQPFEYRIFDSPELVKMVSNIPFGTGGYADNIPAIIVVVGRLDSYFSTRDRHLIYIDSSLASMSFMYAAETLGLSTCPINWPDFEPLEAKIQKKLGLKVYERPIMLMAVGFADPQENVPFSEKKDLDSLRSYNKIG